MRPRRSAVFTVRLPSVPKPVERPQVARPARSPAPRCRIVLVEDNDDGREIMRVALTPAGHEVHEAADGPSGLELLRAMAPDVAIIDVGLPGLDGYEVAGQIRQGSLGPPVAPERLTRWTGRSTRGTP